MSGPPLTTEQRAARSVARRALARRVAFRSTLGALALVVVVAIFAWWLLTTIGGRDLLLRQIVARLPAGTTLTWQQAQGPVSGPMTLHGVRFAMPRALDSTCMPDATHPCATGLIVFSANTIVLNPALRPLLGRRLRLNTLDISGATLELPKSTQPFTLPRWPQSLPQITPPLALQADRIRIDHLKVTRDHLPLVDIRSARAGVDVGTGTLHVDHLDVDSNRGRFTLHGDYVPREDYRTDLVATVVLPAPGGHAVPRLGLVARGDLSRMAIALAGNAPGEVHAGLTLRGKQAPRWSLHARADAFDPGVLSGTPSIPIALTLQADGNGGAATVQGHVVRGGFVATVPPSHITLVDQVLQVQPLLVDTFGGRISLRGTADLRDPHRSSLKFAVNARGLRWGGANGTPVLRADADFGIAGKPDAWSAVGTTTLLRGAQAATLRFDGRGNSEQVAIQSLRATTPGGVLQASGNVRWSPGLAWTLDTTLSRFDLGYLFAGWDGAIDGHIATHGAARNGGGFDAAFDAPKLDGRLRGRDLHGHGALSVSGNTYAGNVALAIGGSHIDARGTVADTLDINAKFDPLQLADLLPQAGGNLQGTLKLTGLRNAPDIDAALSGHALHYKGYRADALDLHGRLPWQRGNGALTIDARGLQAGVALDSLHVDARGAMQALQLQANALGPLGAIRVSGNAEKRGADWQGTLDSLQLSPAKLPAWQLQAPTHFAQHGSNWQLSHGCLTSSASVQLCAAANWPRPGLTIDAHGVPLALATAYLPPRDGTPWLLHGEVALSAQVHPVGNGWTGVAHITSASGGLRNSERSRRDLVAYSNLALDAKFDPQHVDATLGAALDGGGHIDARVATGWDAYAPLTGDIAMHTTALTWMELLSPDIVDPTGRLDGRIALGGTRSQPTLGGQAQLSAFKTELPALAITLTDGSLRLDAQPDGNARLHGSVRSGDGTVMLEGTLGWHANAAGQDAPLVLNVRGKNVLASDTRDLHAVIDPDVVVRYSAGQPLTVSGRVGVPSARIDLERLDRGATTSPDVVVLDPVDPKRKLATPLALDLLLALGDDVHLRGFGLDGTLGGNVRVRDQPGRAMLATGTLEVGGRYTAYGRKLDITRGHLVWSNSPIGDPSLDIRAQRDVGDVTAGIDVTGHATRPHADIWTDPATDQSNALAYLALGRPLSSASTDESRQLNAASAALTAGGNLLASQLGAKLGLDNAGVSDSRALGGSVLGIGKYLSPKLYIGYGVSLLGTGQVLTLKYLLRKGFDIQIESSTVENRASINYRKEK